MSLETDFRIVLRRRWSRQKDHLSSRTYLPKCKSDEFLTNSSVLILHIDSQIRKVAAITKVSHRPCHSDQAISLPRTTNQIRPSQHPFNAPPILNRTTVCQGGTSQDINKLLSR